LERFLKQVCALRDADPDATIFTQKVDAGNAFRQVPVDARGPLIGYVFMGLVIVDLFLQFGWTSSPAWWEAFGRTLQCIQNAHKPGEEPMMHPEAVALGANTVVVAPDASPLRVPTYGVTGETDDEGVLVGTVGGKPNTNYHVDDGIKAQAVRLEGLRVKAEQEARLRQLTVAAMSGHYYLMGAPSNGRPDVCPGKKVTEWCVEQEILGVTVNTHEMTMGMSAEKVRKIAEELDANWGEKRRFCTAKDAWSLIGKLQWVSQLLRSGAFYMWRLRSLTVRHGRQELHGATIIPIGTEVRRDLTWWKRFFTQYAVAHGTYCKIMVPMARVMCRDAVATGRLESDASTSVGLGGVRPETGEWWQYLLSDEQLVRSTSTEKVAEGDHTRLDINVLELCGIVVNAFMFTAILKWKPLLPGSLLSLMADNTSAVCWVGKAGGARSARAGILIRWLGLIEHLSGWAFRTHYLKGVDNERADCASRLKSHDAQAKLVEMDPKVHWRQVPLPRWVHRTISDLLSPACPGQAFETQLTTSTRQYFASS
jgi:hypothetical protein